MVPSAELRVFQPLDAFAADERAYWERFIVGGGLLRPRRAAYRQEIGNHGLGMLVPTEPDAASIRVLDGEYYACPWRTRLRVLAAILAFREAAPIEGAEEFVPDRVRRRLSRELSRMRRRNPGLISFIMQSPWHVPVRWFVLFDDDERCLEPAGDAHRLRYRTTVRKALRRAERAIPVLRKTDLGPVADVIVELVEWLSVFDARSLLELDYGDLVRYMTWDELDDDHSAREVNDAIRALGRDEFARAAEVYQAVVARWAELRAHESLN
ncbi:MAG TPA: hypothetical protein VHM47_01590 [Actinomycetota bacterium]|nr:hypothetical protein [Actinomycetota bacterium]